MDLEKGIEKLLKGESLGGGAAADGGDDEDDSGFKELDLTKTIEEQNKFEAAATKELGSNSALKQAAQTMMRDFVVLIRQTKLDPVTDKLTTSYENVNVLVGPKAGVDAVKPIVEKFLASFAGTFKTDWKIQAQ